MPIGNKKSNTPSRFKSFREATPGLFDDLKDNGPLPKSVLSTPAKTSSVAPATPPSQPAPVPPKGPQELHCKKCGAFSDAVEASKVAADKGLSSPVCLSCGKPFNEPDKVEKPKPQKPKPEEKDVWGDLGGSDAGAGTAREAYALSIPDVIRKALKVSGISNVPNFEEFVSGNIAESSKPIVLALALRGGESSFATPAKIRARIFGILKESLRTSRNNPFTIVRAATEMANMHPELQIPDEETLNKFVMKDLPDNIAQQIESKKAFRPTWSGLSLTPKFEQDLKNWYRKLPRNLENLATSTLFDNILHLENDEYNAIREYIASIR